MGRLVRRRAAAKRSQTLIHSLWVAHGLRRPHERMLYLRLRNCLSRIVADPLVDLKARLRYYGAPATASLTGGDL